MKSFTMSFRIFLVFLVVVLGSYLCIAQSSSIFAGYKGLPWGSSLADVGTHFYDLEDLGMSEDNILHIYMQKNPIDGVDNRLFYFWNDKMVRVRLFYNHDFVTGIGVENFINKMISSFGKPKDQKLRRHVRVSETESWDILETSWADRSTEISFESKEMLSPSENWIYQLEFQSVKLFKEIKEGTEATEPERDWGW